MKHKERVILTPRGKPVAAFAAIEDLNSLEAVEDQPDVEEFQRVKEEFERSGQPTIAWEKIEAELELLGL